MSAIEYNNLLFEISRRLDELNVLDRLQFMFREKLASGSEGIILDALSLFKELEEQNLLGADRLEEMKELLNGVEEWSLLEKVEKFESKRKEYRDLLEQIIRALDELNELERLIAICRGKIPEDSEQIHDVRSLFKELENQNNLGIHRLDILKAILTEMKKDDLFKEVERFEERRRQEVEMKRRKAKAAALLSSVRNSLTGVLNIKTVFKAVTVVSTAELLFGWSTYDQLAVAINTCVLPAGTSLVNLTDGCVCLTVQAETLSALTTLWNLYQDGTLERRLYNFFVTDEVKERAGGETVEVNVSIEEEEYDKACRELINEARETARIGDEKGLRRNSDSAVFFRPKEEMPVLKMIKERIAVLERKIELLPPEILEDCSPEEKATKFSRQQESLKALEDGEIEEGTDELEISQRHKAKLMDPGKLAFVQKYLEDVADTRSMTTNVSDSGLATQTAASELGTEEIHESSKLCLKDLSEDVTHELILRLQADEAALEKFYQFFGLKLGDLYPLKGRFPLQEIKKLFPDTTVSVLKECFEVLRLYDLVELLEKVKPRSLRPGLSPEQVEKLRRADDRPTKYHSDVAVLVVDFNVEGDTFEREDVRKIETFFKDLNSKNEVAIISLARSQENLQVLREIKEVRHRMKYHPQFYGFKRNLEDIRVRQKARSEPIVVTEKRHLSEINRQELQLGLEFAVKQTEQQERDVKMLKSLMKDITKLMSTAMDEWIHNQETSVSCIAVFVIGDDDELYREEGVLQKLALIPDHAKLVVSPSEFRSIDKVPETLHVKYSGRVAGDVSLFTRILEIFKKRWQSLDLISMMQELKRTTATDRGYRRYGMYGMYKEDFISIKDCLSTLPTFQKKEEKHSS